MQAPAHHWTWTDDDVLAPDSVPFARRNFVVGQRYKMRVGRSESTESHYFAVLNWAWMNLPEDKAAAFPEVEDLRKRALIACGYANSRQIVLSTNADAIKIVAFLGATEGYRVVSMMDNVVTELTAKSQNRESMDAEEFARSKEHVIEYCAVMVGVTVEELVKASHADFAKRKGLKP